ncbi:MAG: ABC transporter permease [Rhodospirillales bacterium]
MNGNGKLRMIIGRLGQSIPSVIGIIIVTFVLTRALPGDPAVYFAGPAATPESIQQIRESLGLDKSWPEQFLLYVRDLATGDLGVSISTGFPVAEELLRRLPASLELTLLALIFSISVALPLGIAAATRPNTWVDQLCRLIVTAGVSLPVFFTGLFMVYIFYYLLGIAPSPLGRLDIIYLSPPQVTGFYTIDALLDGDLELFGAALAQLIMPAVTLGTFTLAPLARMTRGAMLQVLSSDFIRTARASGLKRSTVLYTYAFRNALLPILTTLGMVFSFMLGSNVLVEKVFAWPGIGSFAIEALIVSDYVAVQGFVLAMALLYVALNLTIDILYTLVDPRVGLDS